MNTGDKIRTTSKHGLFIRYIVSKRDPYAAPNRALVQFVGNKGVSRVKLTELKLA